VPGKHSSAEEPVKKIGALLGYIVAAGTIVGWILNADVETLKTGLRIVGGVCTAAAWGVAVVGLMRGEEKLKNWVIPAAALVVWLVFWPAIWLTLAGLLAAAYGLFCAVVYTVMLILERPAAAHDDPLDNHTTDAIPVADPPAADGSGDTFVGRPAARERSTRSVGRSALLHLKSSRTRSAPRWGDNGATASRQ
jgi:hypothetical protein